MKKLSICAALIACSVLVHAQGKTPPSFRNYLNNKNSFLKGPHVHNPGGKTELHFEGLTTGNDSKIHELKKYLASETERSTLSSGALASLLPNGNKLLLLPQDNMPCVVPDQSSYNMPVAKGNNELDKKINGSIP